MAEVVFTFLNGVGVFQVRFKFRLISFMVLRDFRDDWEIDGFLFRFELLVLLLNPIKLEEWETHL